MPVTRRARAIAVGTVLALTVALFSVEYTVKRGDTLSEIAGDHDVSLSDVIAMNDVPNPDLIFPGQVILIPGEDGNPEKLHVVAAGETLVRIASAYGSTAATIARANGLPNPDLILPGQQLQIPPTGKAAPARRAASGSDGESEGSTDTTPAQRSGRFHIVKRGETLDTIAGQYDGVSPDVIAKANGISNGKVYTGTRLFLDGPSFVGTGEGGSGTYVVKGGDRLGDIAAHYDTTISKLADMNGISDINLIRSGQTIKVPGGSGWVCPVDGRYFNDWGFPRGGTRYHEGNDLFAERGSPVRAPVSGTLELIRGTVGGLQFNLHGSDGIEYLGSHLDAPEKTGKVNAGDIVGYVGTSGNAQGTNPHLHFGMYKNGLALNPHPTLVANGC